LFIYVAAIGVPVMMYVNDHWQQVREKQE